MDANSNSKSPSTAKIVDHVVSIATPQSNVDVKMATQKRYNRKSWMQAIKCISGVLMFIFLILLVCASYVELERKISKNESQINLCLQKIQKLSRDNRRLKLQVRRLETETQFPDIIKKTSPEETLTFREGDLQTAKVGGSDTDQSSPSSSSQLQFPFLQRNTKPLIRNKRRGGKKGSKGKKKKCKCDLPAIHVQGSSTQQCKKDKSDMCNPWVRSDLGAASLSNSKSPILLEPTGRVRVNQDGIYLVYAQIALNVSLGSGYKVFRGNTILSECTMKFSSGSDVTCSTFGIFRLKYGEEIYIEESGEADAVRYAQTYSSFGIVRVGR